MGKKGFHFNQSLCSGCHSCMMVCKENHHLPEGAFFRRVSSFVSENGSKPGVFHLSLACNHCMDPACVANCPAGALSKDENDGSVKVDVNRCIGCKTCSQVCPFDVPQYREEEGTMAKCDLCGDRRQMGLEPACVQTCFNHALKVGPLESLRQEASGRTERKLNETTEVSVIIVE